MIMLRLRMNRKRHKRMEKDQREDDKQRDNWKVTSDRKKYTLLFIVTQFYSVEDKTNIWRRTWNKRRKLSSWLSSFLFLNFFNEAPYIVQTLFGTVQKRLKSKVKVSIVDEKIVLERMQWFEWKE
jgi:hypothetical protein